jgi:hypothetical protein
MATTKRRARPDQEQDTEAVADRFPLAEEVRAYEAHLPGWADREGQFVLIKGRTIHGFYPRHEEALEAGYVQLGGGPFLVKQIVLHEPIYQLGDVEL